MSGRVVWAIGFVVSLTLFRLFKKFTEWRELSFLVVLLTLGVTALVNELFAWNALRRGSLEPRIPEGARPADGVVEFLAMSGVDGEACRFSPGYRRFVGLVGDEESSGLVGKVTWSSSGLLGRIAFISVFVGRDGVPWSDFEIAAGHEALSRAAAWIEREAIRYQAPVNIGLVEVYFRVEEDSTEPVEVAFWQEGNAVGPMETHASLKAFVMASRSAATLGFRDIADWMSRINSRVDADTCVWLFHVRQKGRSHAILPADSGIDGVGFAVCYASDSSFPEPLIGKARFDPATLAHEVLHLFGATDKYNVPLRSFPQGLVSSREIMRLSESWLSRLRIDPLTAREIGWGASKTPAAGPVKERRRA